MSLTAVLLPCTIYAIMKLNYNHKTKRFSMCNLTEDEANAILRSLSIVVEKMD